MHPEWNRARERYEQIQPPEELSYTVSAAVRQGDRERRRKRAFRRGLSTALAGCACFALLVNASPTFAQAVSEVPVLSGLARIFTVTEYQVEDEEHLIDVRLPAVENTGDAVTEERINQEISTRIQALIDEAEARAQETRDAFVATGGDPAEFAPVIIDVDYRITCQNDRYLSFVVTESETRATANQQFFAYTIDLETGAELTLEDLLGPEWKELANEAVREQIAQRSQDPSNAYWDGSNGIEGFASIRDDQPFYLNAAGNPVVMFEEYEIAPGYMGIQEFEIVP